MNTSDQRSDNINNSESPGDTLCRRRRQGNKSDFIACHCAKESLSAADAAMTLLCFFVL